MACTHIYSGLLLSFQIVIFLDKKASLLVRHFFVCCCENISRAVIFFCVCEVVSDEENVFRSFGVPLFQSIFFCVMMSVSIWIENLFHRHVGCLLWISNVQILHLKVGWVVLGQGKAVAALRRHRTIL